MWEVVGVSAPEERVYEALIRSGPAAVSDLAAENGITRERAARILARLADQGLATRLPGRPARFAAVMPELAASALIAAQESQLRRLRAHAQLFASGQRALPAAQHPAELIEVIEGALNVRNAFVRLRREARKQIRVFDKPPYTGDQPEGNPDEYQPLDAGQVRYRTIYDRAGLVQPGRIAEIRNGIQHGERARVARSLPMKMALCDDRLALIPVATSGHRVSQAAYLIHPSSLLAAFSELFEVIWQRAVPLKQAHALSSGEPVLSERDRDLLGLLAGGATDAVIAGAFGCSVRTVVRQVRRIMTMTGAENRFQAGMEASRRGWV
jgi:DNA-binding CsgD family transcriptional regulator/DNA-binding Lrp family transcriptional regulator